MDSETEPSSVVEFGRFTLDRYRREFFADGRLVELGAGVRCGGRASRGDEGPLSYNVVPSADVQRELRLGETR